MLAQPNANCIHYWIIEPAQEGRPSAGICKKCDAVKTFENSTYSPYNPWTTDRASNRPERKSIW